MLWMTRFWIGKKFGRAAITNLVNGSRALIAKAS
jgi:hypothetical protein